MTTESMLPAEQQDEEVAVHALAGTALPPQKTRKQIVVATLLFNWVCIMTVIVYGKPDNSLHASALAWSFTSMLAVIFAFVFGAVADNYNVWKKLTMK